MRASCWLTAFLVLTQATGEARASEDAQSELVLWHSYRAGEAQAVEQAVAQFRAEAVARFPGSSVRVLSVPFGAYYQKLLQSIPAGQGPDLFIAGHDKLGDLLLRQLVAPVAAAGAAAEERARFEPQTLVPLTREGVLWGWPLAYKTLALFYRTDLVAAPPRTTDELIATARRVTGEGRFGFVYEIGNFYYHAPWFFGFGGELLTADEKLAPLDTDAAAASGDLLRTLLFDAEVTPGDVNGALVTELFNRGRAAMVVNGPWFMSEIAEGVPFAVAPLPTVSATSRPARPFSTVEALFLTARGARRPEVLALAAALTSDEAAVVRATLGRQPVANSAAYAHPSLSGDPTLATFRAQLAASMPMPTAPVMQLVWEPLAGALRQISRGAVGSRTAFAQAQARIRVLSHELPSAVPVAPYAAGLGLLVVAALGLVLWRLPHGVFAQMRRNALAYVFLAPTALGMALLVGIPFLVGVGVGFFSFGPEGAHFVGLKNFASILSSRDYAPTEPLSFYFALAVTVLWTVANVTLHVVLGFGLALLLSPEWLRGKGVFRVLLILPWAVPSYITALVWKGLFNQQLGAINGVLSALGVAPVAWFDGFWPAFAANLATNVWLGFPFMMVTVLGALQAIPQDLYEAARVDGAGAVRRFVHVTLPLVGPALVPAVVLGTIWTFNMFNVVFLVSEGQPEGATDILVTEAYRWAFARNGQYGYAAAYSLIIFLILAIYSALTKRLLATQLEQTS